jgi:hypothetical protein
MSSRIVQRLKPVGQNQKQSDFVNSENWTDGFANASIRNKMPDTIWVRTTLKNMAALYTGKQVGDISISIFLQPRFGIKPNCLQPINPIWGDTINISRDLILKADFLAKYFNREQKFEYIHTSEPLLIKKIVKEFAAKHKQRYYLNQITVTTKVKGLSSNDECITDYIFFICYNQFLEKSFDN